MKPLIVLLLSFVIAIFAVKLLKKDFDISLSARIAMSIMLAFTAIAHFIFTKGMAMMIPEFIPFKTNLVYLTGVLEVLFAIGLLVPSMRVFTAWALIAFLVLMLPANIHAAMQELNYQEGTYDGHGLAYLWFRIPLQMLFIAWVYLSSIRVFVP